MDTLEGKVPTPPIVVIDIGGRLPSHIYGFVGRRGLDVRVNALQDERAEVVAVKSDVTRERLVEVLTNAGYKVVG